MRLRPDQIGKVINARKSAWVDGVMKKHLPPRIYRQMHHTATRPAAMAWLKENGYRVLFEEKGNVIVKKADKVLAQCTVLLELETPEDLLALASAMKK